MIVVNFSHPLSADQRQQIEHITGQRIEEICDIACQLDHDQDFGPQISALADAIPVSAEQWQTTPILVNLPGLHIAAVLLAAELHGRMGHFPACLRLRPAAGSIPTRFEVAEVINLEQVRQQARTRRFARVGGTNE